MEDRLIVAYSLIAAIAVLGVIVSLVVMRKRARSRRERFGRGDYK